MAHWSQWFNLDDPGNGDGDFETLERIQVDKDYMSALFIISTQSTTLLSTDNIINSCRERVEKKLCCASLILDPHKYTHIGLHTYT